MIVFENSIVSDDGDFIWAESGRHFPCMQQQKLRWKEMKKKKKGEGEREEKEEGREKGWIRKDRWIVRRVGWKRRKHEKRES